MAIPVYVINLDRRGDRMAKMATRLSGIEHIRVPAVDGRQFSEWPDGLDVPSGAIINRFEYACLQSHLKAVRMIAAENHPYACILEDDILLSSEFHEYVKSADWIPSGAELIKCETMGSKVWLSRNAIPVADRRLLPLRSFHAGSAGYFISQQGARKLVRMLTESGVPADNLIFDQALKDRCFGEILQLDPAICTQEFVATDSDVDSDIEPSRSIARPQPAKHSAISKIIRELRRPAIQLLELNRLISERRGIVPFR